MSAAAPLVALARAQPAPPIRLALVESLSGPFANTGEAVYRNLLWAVERVNARGGVNLPGGARRLQIDRYDSKGQNEEALSALRAAIDDGARFVMQGRPRCSTPSARTTRVIRRGACSSSTTRRSTQH